LEKINEALRTGNSTEVIDVRLLPKVVESDFSEVVWILRNSGRVKAKWSIGDPHEPV
jgi:hypothetical protein